MKNEDGFKRVRNVEMILLKILNNGDFYGYELTQLVKEYSGQIISLPEGSLYPVLYKLQDKGYVSTIKKLIGKRQERVYYHIEPIGVEYLQTLMSDYYYLNKGIQNILSYEPQQEKNISMLIYVRM